MEFENVSARRKKFEHCQARGRYLNTLPPFLRYLRGRCWFDTPPRGEARWKQLSARETGLTLAITWRNGTHSARTAFPRAITNEGRTNWGKYSWIHRGEHIVSITVLVMLPVGCLLEVSVISGQKRRERERERERERNALGEAARDRPNRRHDSLRFTPIRFESTEKNHVDREFVRSSILTTISRLHEKEKERDREIFFAVAPRFSSRRWNANRRPEV